MHKIAHISMNRRYDQLDYPELVHLAQEDDEAALNELLRRYKRYISNRLYKLAPELKDPSDLIQEVNIRIWRFLKHLREPRAFNSWLSQLIVHVFYDELRKRPREIELISLDQPISNDNLDESMREIGGDCSQQPDQQLLSKELSVLMQEAISSISTQFRTAEVLRDVEGLSYEEIAKITHAELGTVKSRIARARKRIKEQIAEYIKQCA